MMSASAESGFQTYNIHRDAVTHDKLQSECNAESVMC